MDCFQSKTKKSRCWIAFQIGSLLLLLSLGCASRKFHDYRVEIIASGSRDFHLTCLRPSSPIRITSNYAGVSEAEPHIITNGTVIFYVTGKVFDGLGWDSEDLSLGGQSLDMNLTVTGSSVDGEKWWNKIVERDRRFTVQDASDYQNLKETPDVSSRGE